VGTERRRARVIAATVSGVGGILLFVALGGAGLAQSAIALAQYQYGSPGQYQFAKKIVICHKLKNTISVSVNAWPAHQRHGDTVGACVQAATTQTKGKKPKKSTQGAAASATTTSVGTTKTKKPKKQSGATTSTTQTKPSKSGKQKGKPAPTTSSTTEPTTQTGNGPKPKKPKKEKGQNQQPLAPTASGPATEPSNGSPGGRGNGNGGNGNGKGKGNGK
jgi:hypothetical protein